MAKTRIYELEQLQQDDILVIGDELAVVTAKYDVPDIMKKALNNLGPRYKSIDQMFDVKFLDPSTTIYSASEWCHLDLKEKNIYNLGKIDYHTAKLLYIP